MRRRIGSAAAFQPDLQGGEMRGSDILIGDDGRACSRQAPGDLFTSPRQQARADQNVIGAIPQADLDSHRGIHGSTPYIIVHGRTIPAPTGGK